MLLIQKQMKVTGICKGYQYFIAQMALSLPS